MSEHDRGEQSYPRFPTDRFGEPPTPAALDLAAALGGLDRATRNFTRRLGEGHLAAAPPAQAHARAPFASPFVDSPTEDAPPRMERPSADPSPPPGSSFDARMREAEREAHEYLQSAKRRADSLVATMVGAVEAEAAEIRRGAEEGIRARWSQVELDAYRHVENARRVAERMVAERQERIAALSDGITGRAGALTAGMEDAGRVRGQFDAFVRALSITADQIARGATSTSAPGEVHDLPDRSQPSAIAA